MERLIGRKKERQILSKILKSDDDPYKYAKQSKIDLMGFFRKFDNKDNRVTGNSYADDWYKDNKMTIKGQP